MDAVFRALADPYRRSILDRLFEHDGQSLSELAAPDEQNMTRFGVMKHLRVLEAAGLVVRRRDGRTVRHYLNPIPIREIHDRWIDKYREPFARGLLALKDHLEADMDKPQHVFQLYIRATRDKVWDAITNGEMTKQYFFGTTVQSEWQKDAGMAYLLPDGSVGVEGRVLEIDPPRLLVTTWNVRYDGDAGEETIVRWELEPAGDDVTKVTLVHSGWTTTSGRFQDYANGWPMVLSGLKSLVETGIPLAIAR